MFKKIHKHQRYFAKKIFNLKDFLTKRDAWAGTFDVVLNRTTPRTDCPGTLSPVFSPDI